MRHARKLGSLANMQGKKNNQSTETAPKEAQTLDFLEKGFKSAT